MTPAASVTLEITVAPTDFPHAVEIIPHQLRQWGGQVEEILFTFDLHRTSHGGRFADGWEERRAPMRELLDELCSTHPGARIAEVDYSPEKISEVASSFTGNTTMPAKNTNGAPIYPYFYGLHEARNDLVLHLDSDVMFGGSSQTWIQEASELLATSRDVLTCNPLPGPPTADGALRREKAQPFEHHSRAYRFNSLSSRLFFIDRQKLRGRLFPLRLLGPIRTVSRVKARLHGNPPYRAPELSISAAMAKAGLYRVDFLGSNPGMWSLHPPYRSDEFYRELPRLIERIESGDVPEAQRGDYDLNDSMFDWSRARRRRMVRRLWA
jgi:hypothetical protein